MSATIAPSTAAPEFESSHTVYTNLSYIRNPVFRSRSYIRNPAFRNEKAEFDNRILTICSVLFLALAVLTLLMPPTPERTAVGFVSATIGGIAGLARIGIACLSKCKREHDDVFPLAEPFRLPLPLSLTPPDA